MATAGGRNTSWSGDRVSFPPADRAAILKRDSICRCQGCELHDGPCNVPSDEADHIVPVAEGGSNDRSNGQGLCEQCHEVKTRGEIARGRARKSRRRPPAPHPGLITDGGRGGG